MARRLVPPAKWEVPSLLAIMLLATVLRVGWPRLTEFKFSEARLEALALELTREGRLPLVGVPSSAGFDHSPISIYLYAPAFVPTTDPILATIYGGLVGVAAVALCWWLGRRWPGGGRYAALVSALLIAVNPWSVAFSRKIWQVAFVPLLSLVFVALMIAALIEKPSRKRSRCQAWNLAWALAVFALLVQVHPSAVSLAPAVLLWLVLFWRRVRLGPLLAGGALGFLTTIPFLAHQFQSGWPVLAAYRSLPPATWDLAAVRLAWETITGRSIHALAGTAYPLLGLVPQLSWVFNIFGWLTLAACLGLLARVATGWRSEADIRRQAARVDIVLLSWFVIPVLFNLRHDLDLYLHFFALVAPASFLITGRAAELVCEAFQKGVERRPWIYGLAIGGGLGLATLAVGQVVALLLMGRFVATHDTSGGFGVPLGRYQDVTRKTLEMVDESGADEVLIVGEGDSITVDEGPAIFDVLMRDRVPYRFVNGELAALFPQRPAIALLSPDPGAAAVWYQAWPNYELQGGYRLVALDGSLPAQDLEKIEGPRTFENGVEVQGYSWNPDPPDRGQFWLMWQVLWLDSEDTHFFVHLLDDEAQFWGQRDMVGYPSELRQKGDHVINLFDIISGDDSPAEPHWARVGLYLYPEVVNVPVIDEVGNTVGDAISIGPWGRGP